MKYRLFLLTLTILCVVPLAHAQNKAGIANPAIDMEGYLRVSAEAAKHREARRLSEEDFIRMSWESGTVILDARSKQKFDELHIKGAINLSFPDIAVESLKQTFPDKNARILIYCNNNFQGEEKAFPTKISIASLNLSTYIALYSYGYMNVYELGPLIDVKTSKLELVPSSALPPKYRMELVHIFELGSTEFIFVIGNMGLKSVVSLKEYLGTLPTGSTIEWAPGCIRMGGEPLLSSEQEMVDFKAFCAEKNITFILVPAG